MGPFIRGGKTWLQEAADESAVYQYKLWEESVAESMKILEEAGVEVLHPDKEPFRKEAEKVYELMEETDPEMYKLVQEIRKY